MCNIVINICQFFLSLHKLSYIVKYETKEEKNGMRKNLHRMLWEVISRKMFEF